MFSALDHAARALGCSVTPQASLAELTSFRIGGPAARLVELPAGDAAAQVLKLCRESNLPVFWLGKGSNLLVSDCGFDGVVLHLTDTAAPDVHGTQITCPAGVPLLRLCRVACEHGLSGLEFAYGIPGSVGGAVYMNAGAYGGEMKDVLTEAELLLSDGKRVTRPADTLSLGYRHSALMEEGGVLSATVTLTPDDPAAIAARMDECMEKRRAKQPLEYPSAGSFFKRPEGQFAGALIEQCGLKGFRVGDAQVSEKHAGFVVNRGHATCEQVKALAREVRRRVMEQTGFDLVPEVRLLGDTWDD